MTALALAGCLPQLSNALWEGPPAALVPNETGDTGTPRGTGDTGPVDDLVAIEAIAIAAWIGESPNGRFGALVAAIGDVTGDGWTDLAVSAPGSDSDRPGSVFLLSIGDPSSQPPGLQDVGHAWSRIDSSPGGPENIRDGQYVTDVRDSAGTLRAVAIGNTQVFEDQGAVYLVHTPSGVAPAEDYDALAATAGVTSWSGGAYESFGHSVLTGDFDGVGGVEVAVSAPSFSLDTRAGSVYLLPAVTDGLPHGLAEATRIQGDALADHAGRSLDAGDFDGDELPDLVIGAPGSNDAYVLCSPVLAPKDLGADADLRIGSTSLIGRYGHGAHALDDIDGDGRDDLMLVSIVAWYLFSDLDCAMPVELDDSDAQATIGPRIDKSDQSCDDVQEGDFDGDGTQDFAIGDCTVEGGGGGAIYLYYDAAELSGALTLDDAGIVIDGVWDKTGAELVCLACEDGNGWLGASALAFDFGGSADIGAVFLLATAGPF